MTNLLVKDLSRVDELDREAAKAVRGGNLIISKPTDPWPPLPGVPSLPWQPPLHLPVPPVHAGGGGPVIVPYHAEAPADPRLQ